MTALFASTGAKTGVSRSDSFILRTWTNLLALCVLLFISSVIVPILASIENTGFPCFFMTLVDYSTMNLTLRNSAKHITPTLFLEGPEMYLYLIWSYLVDALSLTYFIYAAVSIYKQKRTQVLSLTAIQTWITLVGGHGILYIICAKLWTIQLFIQMLSYKHIFLSAFVYLFHFGLSYLHMHAFVSRNMAQWQSRDWEQNVPEGSSLDRLVFFYRPILANIQMSLLAIEMLVFSLSVMMAVCNSFYMLVSDAVFGAVNLFLFLTVVWHIGAEVFLARYLKHHVGFYIGILVAYVIMLLPVIRYDAIFVAARLHKPITINMTAIPIICLIIMIVRIIRNRQQDKAAAYTYSHLPTQATMLQHIPQPPMADEHIDTDSEYDY